MPPVVYLQSSKSRYNARVERLKDRIRDKLKRPLTGEEEYMIELSAALLDPDDEDPDREDRSDAA